MLRSDGLACGLMLALVLMSMLGICSLLLTVFGWFVLDCLAWPFRTLLSGSHFPLSLVVFPSKNRQSQKEHAPLFLGFTSVGNRGLCSLRGSGMPMFFGFSLFGGRLFGIGLRQPKKNQRELISREFQERLPMLGREFCVCHFVNRLGYASWDTRSTEEGTADGPQPEGSARCLEGCQPPLAMIFDVTSRGKMFEDDF